MSELSKKEIERINRKTVPGLNGCILTLLKPPYHIWLRGKVVTHRRALYLSKYGRAPKALYPRCGNPSCVNPIHADTVEEKREFDGKADPKSRLREFGLGEWQGYEIVGTAGKSGLVSQTKCYSCGESFDPLGPLTKNSVLCNACSDDDDEVPAQSNWEKISRPGIDSLEYSPIKPGGLLPELTEPAHYDLPIVEESLPEQYFSGMLLSDINKTVGKVVSEVYVKARRAV